MRLFSLFFLLGLTVACASAPAAYAPITAHIPAETPFAFVVAAPSEGEVSDASSRALLTPLVGLLEEALQLNLFDPEARALTGLDLQRDWAVYGVDLRPVFLLRVDAPETLEAFLADLEAREDVAVEQEGSITTLSQEGFYVALQRHDDVLLLAFDSAPLALDGLFGARPESRKDALGLSERFAQALKTQPSDAEAVAYLNTAALEEVFLARGAARGGLSSQCVAAGEEVVQAIPFAMASIGRTDGAHSAQVHMRLSKGLADALGRFLESKESVAPTLMKDAFVGVKLSFNFAETAAYDLPPAEREQGNAALMKCANLASLKGGAGLLLERLAATDAPTALGDEVVFALYDFDFQIPLVSKRKGVIAVEARDPAVVAHGLSLLMAGFGLPPLDGPPGLARRFQGRLGFFNLDISETEDHAVITMGKVNKTQLAEALKAPTASPSVVEMALDGTQLQAVLVKAKTDLQVGGFDDSVLETLQDVFSGLSKMSLSVRLEPNALVIEAAQTWSP